MNTQQIGRAGELLVQFLLLREGIESAELTTDAGVDVVGFAPRRRSPVMIQVKTNLGPKRAGSGRGKPALDWWLAAATPAEYVACVDLSGPRVWLFTKAEFRRLAQQHSSGRHHLYMWCDPGVVPRRGRKALLDDFDAYLCPKRMRQLLVRRGA
jgi:hypothetical protein